MTLLLVSTGCNSDPGCQKAIANLRAEKIQIENAYYSLKSQYETDMARMGHPNQSPAQTDLLESIQGDNNNGSIPDVLIEGPELFPNGGSSRQFQSFPHAMMQSGTNREPTEPDLASYIRSVEVSQLPTRDNDDVRLLVRPLDDRGAILPLAGDIKVRFFDPVTRSTVFENEYTRTQIARLTIDQPGNQPGIHVRVPTNQISGLAGRLICDLQYRSTDNRILRQRTELELSNAQSTTGTASDRNPPRTPTRSASVNLVPDNIGGQLQIEIGDELNFDSLDSGTSSAPPQWRPDR